MSNGTKVNAHTAWLTHFNNFFVFLLQKFYPPLGKNIPLEKPRRVNVNESERQTLKIEYQESVFLADAYKI
jgi:hypothetical protein